MCKENKIMVVSMIVNFFLATVKVIAGIIGSSVALVADGMHSFSDLATDVFAILGTFLSHKPADDKHPFGHGKLEYLTSMGIGLIILFVGFSIIFGNVNNKIIVPSRLVIIISVFTIIIKFLLSQYVIKKGYEYNNNVLIASGKESNSDVISSIVVLASAILMQFATTIPIFKYADITATIIVGIFIIKIAIEVLRENISTIIGEQETDSKYLEEIKNIIVEDTKICSIDKLNLIKYGSSFEVIGEVGMDENLTLKESHDVIEQIEQKLKKFDERNRYITIHVNPYNQKETSK
ncbi:MAG: cation transporter [Firmicutes bacterium]|nr:cation transporter [Bacillota bacterium]